MTKRKIKTLVVDDSSLFREVIKSFLEAQSDIDLLEFVDSGEQCLEFVDKFDVDVIIIDVRMPGLDGPATTQQLKKNNPNTQVIICTVWGKKEARNYAIQAGADDYFVKGEPLSVLLSKIHALFPPNGQLRIFSNIK